MNKVMKAVRGVTLLEVMLVLAIAAMIIVMSVRYYQSAQQSSQANAFVSQFQAVAAAAENLAAGSSFGAITAAMMTAALPANALSAPWGGTIVYVPGANGFSLTVPAPGTQVCTLIIAKLPSTGKMTVPAGCASAVYDSTK